MNSDNVNGDSNGMETSLTDAIHFLSDYVDTCNEKSTQTDTRRVYAILLNGNVETITYCEDWLKKSLIEKSKPYISSIYRKTVTGNTTFYYLGTQLVIKISYIEFPENLMNDVLSLYIKK